MNPRRKLIIALGAGALTVPFGPFAQQPHNVWRLTFIGPGRAATTAVALSAFRDGMRENGLREGEHYVLDEKYAEGNYDRFPALTAEVLKDHPAIILVVTIASVRAAQQATKTIPIVFLSTNDPVGAGLVASLARPGGNTTGLSTQNEDLVSKFVELLRELLPRAKKVAVLVKADNPTGGSMFERVRASAGGFGVAAKAFEVAAPESLEVSLQSIKRYRPDALLIPADAALNDQRDRISAFGLKNRIPIIASNLFFVASGSLVSYGTNNLELFRRAATYVKKILAGARPGDLPVEQPTKIELVVNMKTAKALGIKMPQSVLLRADKVIE
jgi:putative tryptophan/tyrosine transport system substrate-binding protein